MVNRVFPFLWIVMNGNDVRFAESEASNVLREINEFLQRHTIRRSLVVCGQQLLLVVYLVDVLPAASRERFENRRPPHVIQHPVPIQWIFQVVQRFRSDVHVAWITLLRQQHGFGNRDSQPRRDRIIEILVVGRPPKRIVDNVRALQNGVLQESTVILDFMRDAVDDHAVLRWLAHARAAQLREFRDHSVFLAEFVHPHDKRWRKAVLPPAEKAHLFHFAFSCQEAEELPRVRSRQFTACAEEVRGSVAPPRVSATRWRTTAFKSPVSRYTRNCRSALVPSFRTVCTYSTALRLPKSSTTSSTSSSSSGMSCRMSTSASLPKSISLPSMP